MTGRVSQWDNGVGEIIDEHNHPHYANWMFILSYENFKYLEVNQRVEFDSVRVGKHMWAIDIIELSPKKRKSYDWVNTDDGFEADIFSAYEYGGIEFLYG